MSCPLLIIGCGNDDRGDDAAGLLVVRRLRTLGFPVREEAGDGASLMESWRDFERVVIVDTVVTGFPAGSIHVWEGADAPVVKEAFRFSSHGFGVAEALELARALERLPRQLIIYGIEGESFEIGSAPSPAVAEAVERLAERLGREYPECLKPPAFV